MLFRYRQVKSGLAVHAAAGGPRAHRRATAATPLGHRLAAGPLCLKLAAVRRAAPLGQILANCLVTFALPCACNGARATALAVKLCPARA